MTRILVTGACGQIGSELTLALREQHGRSAVIASDIVPPCAAIQDAGPFEYLDVTDIATIKGLVRAHDIDTIYNMAAILSATGEKDPDRTWRVNVDGLRNVLETARDLGIDRVFCPSSMAAFGPETPKVETPQETVMRPTTMYGISKVTGELLGNYAVEHYGLDVRGIRYPGIISSTTPPGGGTTDYAVHIFYAALQEGHYTCFVHEDTVLPMLYMPDCIRATLMLMEADRDRLEHHTGFNLAGLSFAAGELVAEIQKHVPTFTCDYAPDYRQAIADSWPSSIDDTAAREEWDWEPEYDLATMVEDMLEKLSKKLDAPFGQG